MAAQLWAFLERAFPRGSAAALMLLLAYYSDPLLVGIYGTAVVCLLLIQSAGDGAIRQVAVLAIGGASGRRFLRRYQLVAAISGGAAMVGVSAVIFLVFRDRVPTLSLYALFLLALIPVLQAVRVVALATLQLADQWRRLAMYQLVATMSAFAVALAMLVSTRSLLAPCIQMVLSEAIFAAVCLLRVRQLAGDERTTVAERPTAVGVSAADNHRASNRVGEAGGTKVEERSPGHEVRGITAPTREFWHMSLYSVLSWGQLQSDRFLMTFFAGPAVLGAYSLGTSVSRSAGDAAAMSSANILRSALAKSSEVREDTDRLITRGLWVVSVASLVSVIFAECVVKRILDEEWDSALEIVPILALGAIPAYLTWSMTVVLVTAGRAQVALPAKTLGVCMSILVAFGATHSLILASSLAVLRELTVCGLTFLPARRLLPTKSLLLCSLVFLVCGGGVLALLLI